MASVLSIKFTPYSDTYLESFAREFVERARQVVTVNAEMALAAREDVVLMEVINHADLRVVDSFGLYMVGRALKQPMPPRVTGVDLMERWLALAQDMHVPVFLLGSAPEVLDVLMRELCTRYPDLPLAGFADIRVDANGNSSETDQIVHMIANHQTRLLFVAFGHGKQEHWIARNLAALPAGCIAMGVGGSFAYLSGVVRRAPCWMRRIGLEWLWRLVCEPRRILRIFRAVFLFPVRALWHRIRYAS